MTWELGLALVLVPANGFFVAVEFSVARFSVARLRPTRREGAAATRIGVFLPLKRRRCQAATVGAVDAVG